MAESSKAARVRDGLRDTSDRLQAIERIVAVLAKKAGVTFRLVHPEPKSPELAQNPNIAAHVKRILRLRV